MAVMCGEEQQTKSDSKHEVFLLGSVHELYIGCNQQPKIKCIFEIYFVIEEGTIVKTLRKCGWKDDIFFILTAVMEIRMMLC